MEVREKEVQSLQSQALALSQEDAGITEVDGQQRRVTDNFSNLQEPLKLRRLLSLVCYKDFERRLSELLYAGPFSCSISVCQHIVDTSSDQHCIDF